MGREKDEEIEREEARDNAAERGGRTCAFCPAVISHGTDPGPNGECPACIGAH